MIGELYQQMVIEKNQITAEPVVQIVGVKRTKKATTTKKWLLLNKQSVVSG